MKTIKKLILAFILIPLSSFLSCAQPVPGIGWMQKPMTTITAAECDTSDYVSANTFNVSTYESSPRGIGISPDGTYIYICGNTGDEINQFTLGTPGDLTTISHTNFKTIAAYEALAWDMYINPTGTKLYVVGFITKEVTEFTLTTAWDITTLTYVREKAMSAYDTGNPYGICFSDDGSFMYYITNAAGNVLNSFELTTSWDVSTITNHTTQSLVSIAAFHGLFISQDGTSLYTQTSSSVRQYKMSTPYDISTLSLYSVAAGTGVYPSVDDAITFLEINCTVYGIRNGTDTMYQLLR